MVSQEGINLAVNIITTAFNNPVGKVCSCLLRKGILTFHEIVTAVQLSNSQVVRDCLNVLIQHNCVQAFSAPRTVGSDKMVIKYMVIFDNILHRLHFSKFVAIVRREFPDSKCESLLEDLIRHGRSTFDKLVVRENFRKGGSASRDSLRVDLERLIKEHYVERCPKTEPFIAPTPEEITSAKKHSSKDETSLEQQVIIAATLSNAERFPESINTNIEAPDVKDEHNQRISVGDKRKFDVLGLDEEFQAATTENDVDWRVNFQKFISSLKKEVCVETIRSRLGPDAGVVLEALIDSTNEETINSVKAPIDSILEAVRGKPGGIAMTWDHIRVVLDQIGCSSYSEDNNVYFTCDLQSIIQSCQNNEADNLVLKRHGKEAQKLFRFLIKEGFTETNKIAEKTLIHLNDCPRILNMLWKDEYVRMEIVTLVGRPRFEHPAVWKVDKDSIRGVILNHIYHFTLNLNIQIAQKLEQECEANAQREEEKSKKLYRARMILEGRLLEFNKQLIIFHDFMH